MKLIIKYVTAVVALLLLAGPYPAAADELKIFNGMVLPNGQAGTAYTPFQLSASGGTGSYEWSASGIIPPGIELSTGGEVSGTPTSVGIYSFMIQVNDTSTTVSKQFVLHVPAAQVGLPVFVPAQYGDGINDCSNCHGVLNGPPAGHDISNPSTTLDAHPPLLSQSSGATFKYHSNKTGSTFECSLDGEMFADCNTLDDPAHPDTSPRVITYSNLTLGDHTFVVRAMDAGGIMELPPYTNSTYSWTYGEAPLSIQTASLPKGLMLTTYNQPLEATGGTPPYTWQLQAGSPPLPPELVLGADGIISGNPLQAGTWTFTVQVTDQASTTAYKPLSIEIERLLIVIPENPGNYRTVQSALNAVPDQGTIKLLTYSFIENPTLDRSITCSLIGGYNDIFTENIDYTTIRGLLTIKRGTAIIERVIIQ